MLPALNPAAIQAQDRATPSCPHFGPCGGCQLQHLTYAAQLRDKSTHLRALLEATDLALPTLQLHPSPPLAYRNRIRLTLAEVGGQGHQGGRCQVGHVGHHRHEVVVAVGRQRHEVGTEADDDRLDRGEGGRVGGRGGRQDPGRTSEQLRVGPVGTLLL